MAWFREPARVSPPRTLLVSQRRGRCGVSQALRFEFEDVVRAIDAVDLVSSDRISLPPPLMRRASGLLERFSPVASALLERDQPRLEGGYDLLFVAAAGLADLPLIRPLALLQRRAQVSVCLVDEVWRKGLESRTGELRLLSRFDLLFVGTAGSVEPVAELTGRPCVYLPPSVDAAALCPYPEAPARVIDVYSMGRRSLESHRALLELSKRKGWFYMYETLERCSAPDYPAHRRHLGDLLKRSRYFFAYPGKVNAPEQTGGQQELGFRYFEGAAAGAVLVGEAPANPWSAKLFGWDGAIVPLRYGCADPAALEAALDLDPEREEAIRRTNVVESLRRHDHVYRWAEVLHAVGLVETPEMQLRRDRLRNVADSIAHHRGRDAPPGPLAMTP